MMFPNLTKLTDAAAFGRPTVGVRPNVASEAGVLNFVCVDRTADREGASDPAASDRGQ